MLEEVSGVSLRFGGDTNLLSKIDKCINEWRNSIFFGRPAFGGALPKSNNIASLNDTENTENLGEVDCNLLHQEILGLGLRRQILVAFLNQIHQVLDDFKGLEVVAQRSVDLGLGGVQCLQHRAIGGRKALGFLYKIIAQHGLDGTEKVFEILLLCLGVVDGLVAVVHRFVPRLHQEHESELSRRMFLQGLTDCDEILERFRHLESLDVQVSRVEKIIDPLAALMKGLRLSHFVVVMREHEIDTSTVNVNVFTDHVTGHDAAFDVPTRTAGSPW
mmetsp:Transcript_14306/g.39902  ORF Transcript_14306/g.39902 Transcript_14306/m.39902 type:complete len:274 (-) Transcript_14306:1281-2102(-)